MQAHTTNPRRPTEPMMKLNSSTTDAPPESEELSLLLLLLLLLLLPTGVDPAAAVVALSPPLGAAAVAAACVVAVAVAVVVLPGTNCKAMLKEPTSTRESAGSPAATYTLPMLSLSWTLSTSGCWARAAASGVSTDHWAIATTEADDPRGAESNTDKKDARAHAARRVRGRCFMSLFSG